MTPSTDPILIGVLALQGAFVEHISLLQSAASKFKFPASFVFSEVRTAKDLATCDALIIPGGESTAISLVASRSGLLEPLREFVKVDRKPTWGTCAGLILLAEAANVTSAKKGGQDLIGGLDVRVNRNHFGRQVESFTVPLHVPFLSKSRDQIPNDTTVPFPGVFIRAPIVEKILPHHSSPYATAVTGNDSIAAPSKVPNSDAAKEFLAEPVEVLVTLPGRVKGKEDEAGDVVAVKQGNVFGTSFHPELTTDWRIHAWWLEEVVKIVERRRRTK